MIENELTTAVQSALAECKVDDSRAGDVASDIAETAVFDSESGRQILVMRESELIEFDTLKAILAAAGILGATIPIGFVSMIIGPLGAASVLSAISALGALKGLKRKLPRRCAYLVMFLLEEKKMKMGRDKLQEKFKSIYDGPEDLANTEFERTLEQLEQVGSIDVKQGEVQLVEHVIIRR